MRPALRFLICILMSSSIALAALPVQLPAPQVEEADCCSKMNAHMDDGCDRHSSPMSDHDKQCCAACAFGLTLFVSRVRPFVYPAVGDETYAAFISAERSRSDRPPVPPPRA